MKIFFSHHEMQNKTLRFSSPVSSLNAYVTVSHCLPLKSQRLLQNQTSAAQSQLSTVSLISISPPPSPSISPLAILIGGGRGFESGLELGFGLGLGFICSSNEIDVVIFFFSSSSVYLFLFSDFLSVLDFLIKAGLDFLTQGAMEIDTFMNLQTRTTDILGQGIEMHF